jgi:hypothetical protein
MTYFPLLIHEGHPYIELAELTIFVDTGAPATVHHQPSLTFCGEKYPCITNFMGLTTEKLSEMLGRPITTLLGADILSRYVVFFDYPNGKIGFGSRIPDSECAVVPLRYFMGIPLIRLDIAEQQLNLFLDTGAKLSYLRRSHTASLVPTGHAEDFYPTTGQFSTPTFEIPTTFEGKPLETTYGNLPDMLELTLTLSGTDGIIGHDFFRRYRVWLDGLEGRLGYCQ